MAMLVRAPFLMALRLVVPRQRLCQMPIARPLSGKRNMFTNKPSSVGLAVAACLTKS